MTYDIPVQVVDEKHKFFNRTGTLVEVIDLNAGKAWKVRIDGATHFFFSKDQLKRVEYERVS